MNDELREFQEKIIIGVKKGWGNGGELKGF